ncbi:MAG: DUF3025 domain-containing protein [Stenotrophomonas sp.]
MTRRRFVAPLRSEVDPACFEHPLFDGCAGFDDWLRSERWPDIDALNARLPVPGRRFIVQDRELLDDGLHYETRIAAHGRIATRPENWHDLFNAMVWVRYPAIKAALNARQCLHIAQMGTERRNRAQQALTQFDETGVIVRVRDPALLELWDRHAWAQLFDARAGSWHQRDIAIVAVIGHALLEQGLLAGRRMVGKCVVVQGEDDVASVAGIAEAIAQGGLLNDPLELRPLPLAGVPGWHRQQDAAFYAQSDYFRPLREGRVYPAPLRQAILKPL